MGYPPIVVPKILKKWKMVITSVEQEYEFTKEWQDYKTSSEIIYRGWGQLMDIGKSNDNFKDGKSKYFNYSKYRHIAKEC